MIVALPLRITVCILAIVLAGIASPLLAQSSRENPWQPNIVSPLYPKGKGPVVVVDEAHFNFHTIDGQYRGFAQTLERDGYVVRPGRAPFSATILRAARILVIVTALSERNRDLPHWSPPITSAFSADEIDAVQKWVRDGGSLLLIADHLPFAGAMQKLAAAFGIKIIDGYALDRREIRGAVLDRPFIFTRKADVSRDGSIVDHPITHGRNYTERVDRVMTFMGSAFRADKTVMPLLVFGKEIRSYQTETFGKLSASTPSVSAAGLMQGAALRYGKGRVVLYSEAGMFGVNRQRGVPVGMNRPGAAGNLQLLLNTMHWLDGTLK